MKRTKISLIQMDVKLGELRNNLETAIKFIEKAMSRNSDIVVLPEMWPTGFDYQALSLYPEHYFKDILSVLSKLADKGKAYIVAGSMAEVEGGKFYNTSFVIDPFGNIIGKYRKVHLFSPTKENEFFSEGDEAFTAKTKVGNLGVAICYDLRFPELFRSMSLSGAEIICVPAEFPKPRMDHWLTLLKARAIENQCFVAGVNRVGKAGKTEYFGHSVIFGPYGEAIAEAGEKEALITADLDLDKISEIRSILPSLTERRPAVYQTPSANIEHPLAASKAEYPAPPKAAEQAPKAQETVGTKELEREEFKDQLKEMPKAPEPIEIKEIPVDKPCNRDLGKKDVSRLSRDLVGTKLSFKETGQPMKSRK